MRKFTLLVLTGLLSTLAFGQQRFFADAGANKTVTTTGQRTMIPEKFRTFTANVQDLKTFLWSLPSEANVLADHNSAPVIELPMPDGSTAKFHVWESSIMQPGLSAQFPEIKTFAGQGIDDPYASIRFSYDPYFGFRGMVLSATSGRIFIDPYARHDLNSYISYYARDSRATEHFRCDVPEDIQRPEQVEAGPCRGITLLTYRLALACTHDYATAVCSPSAPTTSATLAEMTNAVNRVTGVYEQEFAIRMTLVANTNLLINIVAAGDPYTNNNGTAMLGQNQTNIDNIIGAGNYDIGHVFSTGGGGIAGLGVVCTNGQKARGVTGLPNPVGDDFYIDYVAHEMGHQFGGNHTFNSVTSNCGGGNRNGSTAYEVGSGTTIMAYAGICGSDDTQPHSDPFFHTVSFDEISNRSSGAGGVCPTSTATGNILPVITVMNNNMANIPLSTPFTLTGSATDANGDALTYCWEEWDLGPSGAWNGGATSTTAPLFKSRPPKTTGSRTFPDIAVILAGYPANPAATMGGLKGETLPTVARAMKFRLTVRDNRAGGGGVVTGGDGCQAGFTGIFQVNTIAATGPFVVTVPNGGESYPGGSAQTVTWNVAGTDVAPISVSNVKISLSTDGGLTYPTVIVASTPNDGSESVTIPSVVTTTARIKVEAVGNIFFDISNANFTITVPPNGFTFNSPAAVTATCPATNVMTSGNLTATYAGTFTGSINLTGTVSPSGPAVSFSNNPLTTGSPSTTVSLTGMAGLSPGNYTVTVTGTGTTSPFPVQTRDIVFTINPGAGPAITLQPASQSVCQGGTVTFTVAATGALTYQWQRSTDGGTTWPNVVGATGTSYTIVNVQPSDAAQYRCVITGQCGSSNSNAAILTVNVPPSITGNPTSQAVCSGSSVSFTVTASGSGLSYQWQLSTNGGGTWNDIVGATSATYTIAATTVAMNNNQYRCVVTGTCSPTATSTAATLTVNSSVTVTTNPTNSTICEGTGTSFTSAASGTGLNYQWQVSTDGGTTWNNVSNGPNYSGATTPTLTLINTPPSFNGNRYRDNITSPPCTPGVTTSALLTVNTFPVIGTQPQNATICETANVTFSVAATTAVGSLTYQWQVSTDGGTTWTNLAGATNSSFAQTNVPATQNGYKFRVIVTAGCGSSTSSVATLTVNTYPVFTLTNLPTTVCLSDPSFTLSASLAGGVWSGTGVSGSTFSPSVAGLGSKVVTYTAINAGCTKAVSSTVQVNECAERHRLLNAFQAVFIYPVPNDGRFSIRMNSDLYTNLGVRVYGVDGKLYRTFNFTGIGYGSVMPIDMSGLLHSGVYHLYLYNNEHGFISKAGSIIVVKP